MGEARSWTSPRRLVSPGIVAGLGAEEALGEVGGISGGRREGENDQEGKKKSLVAEAPRVKLEAVQEHHLMILNASIVIKKAKGLG